MNKTVEEKLAGSLTAETTDLLPFLPYLLQDFWELGSDPATMAALAEKYVTGSKNTTVLDLGCGKGAVSIAIAQKLHAHVKGFDLMPAFIDFSIQKASEHGVADLCDFKVGDVNQAVQTEKNYDLVILGAVGDALGSPSETLRKLKKTIKTGGYILIDEGYLKEDVKQEDIGYNNYEYLTEKQWATLFTDVGLELVETVSFSDAETDSTDSDAEMKHIKQRAKELIEKYPDQKPLFEGYVASQQREYDDLDNHLEAVVWMLRKL